MNKVSNGSREIIKITAAVIIPMLTLVLFVMAGETASAQTLMDTGAATSIGATVDSGPAINAGSIRNKIRADIEAKTQNLKNNQDARNIMVEKRIMGSTTPNGSPIPPPRLIGSSTRPYMGTTTLRMNPPIELRGQDDRNIRPGIPGSREASSTRPYMGTSTRMMPAQYIIGRTGDKPLQGSTSPIIRHDDQGQNRPMDFGIFRQKKENAAKQFEVAVNNLKNLRERIGSRIEKEAQLGKDMTKAKQLLATADSKLAQLKNAMDALKAFAPASSTPTSANINGTPSESNTAQAPTNANLDAARSLIQNVQKSIRESQKALNDTIIEIAHVMGVKLGNPEGNATSTSTQ